MTSPPIPFVKGHGTGNDFVVLTDLDGSLGVTPELVVALCDRRRGLGGDGVLVVTRTEAHAEVADQAPLAPYFMDYRNADGSVAQMCGNGARVFVAHLLDSGLVEPGRFRIATRGGVRPVRADAAGGPIVIDMGTPEFLDREGLEVRVGVGGAVQTWAGVGVLMPNPHAVAFVEDVQHAGPLLHAPDVTPAGAFPEGVNVEFVRVVTPDHIEMRVFERGVGETLSCGTGACAAAVATLRGTGHEGPGGFVRVDVPGGALDVRWLPGGTVELGGPAELVASGVIDRGWWERHG